MHIAIPAPQLGEYSFSAVVLLQRTRGFSLYHGYDTNQYDILPLHDKAIVAYAEQED